MTDRTRRILEDLEAVRENLLGLSDDIWQSIDHNDSEAMEEGVQFKRTYNEKLAGFDRLATDISALVQQYTSVRLQEEEETGLDDTGHNERIIRELSREEPHSLDEDFRWKRPHGFILDGRAFTGIRTWRRLFELVCQQLLQRDRDRFHGLLEHADFISIRGNHGFSLEADHLRSAALIGEGIHAEVNLSANSIRDQLRKLLPVFEVPEEQLQIFLRQDRDAEPHEG